MTQQEQLAQNLKSIRKQKHLTQEKVAYTAGVCLSSYSRIERGKQTCKVDTLKKLAQTLETDVGTLLGGDLPPADEGAKG